MAAYVSYICADAGPDSSIDEGATTLLGGKSTPLGSYDPDGDSLGYEWTQVSGPFVFIEDADTATPKFKAPQVDADTDLVFQLVVTDQPGGVDSLPDTTMVTVLNQLPVAQAGDNNTVGGALPPLTLLGLVLLALRRRRRYTARRRRQ